MLVWYVYWLVCGGVLVMWVIGGGWLVGLWG